MSVVKSIIIGVVLLAVIIGVAVWAKNRPAPSASPEPSVSESVSPVASASVSPVSNEIKNNMHEVTITTNLGDIVFQTYDADTPKTVENFVTLAGKGFYKDVIFHRVIEGFMIQGGDPTGTGSGGPGYQFADELNPDTESYKKGYTAGTVAMANAGPNTTAVSSSSCTKIIRCPTATLFSAMWCAVRMSLIRLRRRQLMAMINHSRRWP